MKKYSRSFFYLLLSALIILFLVYSILFLTQEPYSLNSELRKTVSGQFIRLSKGEVHYDIQGDKSNPLLILIGGAGLGYNVWDKNVSAITKNGFRVLRYDHYGRGYSDRVNQEYTLDLFYNQFTELLDSLNIDKPFDVAGLSMGAMVAMKFTDQNPDLVKKLILIDPAGVNPFRAPWVLRKPVISDFLMTIYWRPRAVKKQMEEFYSPSEFAEYEQELEKQIKISGYKEAQHSIWLNTLSIDLSNTVKTLKNHQKDVLLIWGKQDPRTLFQYSEYYIREIPNIKFIVVDKAGHLSNYEKPEIVNPAILRFLKD